MEPLALADLVEHETYRALAAADAELPRPLGLRAELLAGALVLRSARVSHVLLNRVFLGREHEPDAVALLESAVARFRAQGTERFFVQLPQGPQESPLRRRLQALGLVPYPRSWHKLLGPIHPTASAPSAASLSVTPATPDDARALGQLLAAGFELPADTAPLFALSAFRPGFAAYVARDSHGSDATPIAALLTFEHAAALYVMLVATDPAFRGRGALPAMLARALRDSADRGCTFACAETGAPVPDERNPSHDALVRAGLAVAQVRENWAPAGASWAAGTTLSRRAR